MSRAGGGSGNAVHDHAREISREELQHSVSDEHTTLPSSAELLFAVRARVGTASPLVTSAGLLARLYDELAAEPAAAQQIRLKVAELIVEIDTWVAGNVPCVRRGPAMGTETVGSVIARLAEAQVGAQWMLTCLSPNDFLVHLAWEQLAEIRNGYEDLAASVHAGRVRLPRSWRSIEAMYRSSSGAAARSGDSVTCPTGWVPTLVAN